MEFEAACSEMDFIIKHMDFETQAKIPDKLKQFFYENKSIFYKVKLTTEKPLYDQELKDDTKAFIEIIKEKYLLNDVTNEQISNNEKLKIGNSNFKIEKNEDKNVQMTIYKNNKLAQIFRKIFKFFNKKI